VFVQQVLGATFAQLYGLIADGTPRPMIAATTLCAALGVAAGAAAFALSRRGANVGAERAAE
jgi:DHA1 family bicyclomycin/chloramphenicol resistance-like MFS transporter